MAGCAWDLEAGAGLAANDSDFTSGNPNAPKGTQVLFLQGLGTATQSNISIPVGNYRVKVLAAQRVNVQASAQTFQVLVDGKSVGWFTPPDGNYTECVTDLFPVDVGTHTLAFAGANPDGGDNTVFLSQLKLEDPVGNTYNIGPGQTYSSLVDLFTTHGVALAPGDTVNVYPMYNPDGSVKPYYEKPFLYWSGSSATSPITLQGVPDTQERLPILDGTNAVETYMPSGYTGIDYQNDDGSWSEYGNVALLTILPPQNWNGTDTYSYWNIRNFKIQNCLQTTQYKRSRDGVMVSYDYGYGIYFAIATHVLVENCEIENCTGGILYPCYEGKPLNKYVTVREVKVHDTVGDSSSGSAKIHAVYGEAFGSFYDRLQIWNINGFGVKDRGAGTVMDACVITACTGACVQFVEPEGGGWALRQLEPTGTQVMKGCTLKNTLGDYCVIFGWDNTVNDDDGNRLAQTTLRSYYNTLVDYNSSNWYVYPWKVKDTCFVITQNDILHQSGSAEYYIVGSDSLTAIGTVTVNLTSWIDSNYRVDNDPVNGSGGVLVSASNLTLGTDPLFTDPDNGDFSLQTGSPCRGLATALPTGWTYPMFQFNTMTGAFVQRTSLTDVGSWNS